MTTQKLEQNHKTNDQKKGGRYTKKEQEERRLQVYHLHFEKNKSALEIAKILDVNRNTINEDVKFWLSKLGNDLGEFRIKEKMKQEILRLENQRDRFYDYLEEAENLNEKIRVEKFIFDIGNRLSQLWNKPNLRMIENVSSQKCKSDEEEIDEFVKNLILSNKKSHSSFIYSGKSLIFEFVKKTKCDQDEAEGILDKMIDYGLDFYEIERKSPSIEEEFSSEYDLGQFAILRGYFSQEEMDKLQNPSN